MLLWLVIRGGDGAADEGGGEVDRRSVVDVWGLMSDC